MKQLMIGFLLGALCMGGYVWAEQSRWNPNTFQFEPVPQPTPQDFMLQYNLNRWLQQQAQHPC